jgi:bilirubin oxidase
MRSTLATNTLLGFLATAGSVLGKDWESPVYTQFFQFPLPIPPVKTPKATFTSPATGLPIDYYEVDIKPLTRQQYPGLKPARMVGYDGIVPG